MNDEQVTAVPQATGGVSLDKIPELIEKIGSTRLTHLADRRDYTRAGANASLTGMDPHVSGKVLASAKLIAKNKIAAVAGGAVRQE